VRGFYGILLIIALVAVSGLIAYVGDILGRRMGRRRLSLFGMRPRHTAIAISVVAGMLITLFTLTVAMLLSRDVKDGFLRVEYMRRRQVELSLQLDVLNRRIADLDRAGKAAEGQLVARKAELESAKRQRDQTWAELQQWKRELAKTKSDLAKAKADLAEALRTEKTMHGVITRLSKTQFDLQSQIDLLRITAARAAREYALERAVPILFGAGQPLDVELVSGGQPVAAAHRQLDGFVARLNSKVAAAGARPLAGSKEAVIIHKAVRDPKSDQLTVARSYQVLDAVATLIHESTGDVIVRAFSVFNTHAGEPVYVDFELFRNLLVFRRGETLAVTVIDGRLSEPALMGALVSLLRDQVGAKARAQNVMPHLGPGASNLFGSAGGAVGEMTYEDLFRVIERLRRADGPARVSAIAAQDTWTIGPLKVDLRVEPVTAAATP
jgi:uncharacterized protein (DUF3084 family)